MTPNFDHLKEIIQDPIKCFKKYDKDEFLMYYDMVLLEVILFKKKRI